MTDIYMWLMFLSGMTVGGIFSYLLVKYPERVRDDLNIRRSAAESLLLDLRQGSKTDHNSMTSLGIVEELLARE